MARFIIRSIISTIVTMLLVSLLLFILIDVGSGDITVRILGIESTA
jgi:ABC-type dipeptide/oligopeptide/nickel transport system permease component